MEAFARLLAVFAVAFAMLNMFGGIVSGIWLAILGEWELIGYGILALLGAAMGLGLAMAPGLILGAPAVAMLERGNKIRGYFFFLLSIIYKFGVLAAWCILVLIYYTEHADADSIIPALIWSYGVATGPIAWLARKDLQSGNEYAGITTFFVELAYVLTIFAILLVGVSLLNVLVLFGVIMSISLIVQFTVTYLAEKSQAYW